MTISKTLLDDFAHEASITRRLLEIVPEDRFSWQPHERSMTLGRLAGHIVEIPGWAGSIMGQEEHDLLEGSFYTPFEPSSPADLLVTFGDRVSNFLSAVLDEDDAVFAEIWVLRRGTNVLFRATRQEVLRRMLFHHFIHHRGQLTVYLRLLDIPLPQSYGPTGDAREFSSEETESRRLEGRRLDGNLTAA